MGEEEELVDDLFHVGEEDGEAEDKVDEGRDSWRGEALVFEWKARGVIDTVGEEDGDDGTLNRLVTYIISPLQ